jgi:DNA adenine methylase
MFNCDFEEVIQIWDSPETLFYCDPPYLATGRYYKNMAMGKEDHLRLADTLKTCKGMVILSHESNDFIEELYGSWNVESVVVKRNATSVTGDKRKDRGGQGERISAKELIFTNFSNTDNKLF